MSTRQMICVACPIGCAITVTLDADNTITKIEGNTCKRGLTYAQTECTNPTRSLTTTIKVKNGKTPLVPVKSAKAVPKGKLLDCARYIATLEVDAPVKIGDVLVKNILGTGVDIVATNHNPAV